MSPALNIYDLGDRADLGYGLENASGIPVDATVSAYSLNPLGASVGLTASHVATGAYAALVDLNVPGRWQVRWTATGAAVDSETISLMVRPNAPVRADDAYANIDDVIRHAQGRTFTASSKPAVGDVQDFLNFTKGEIDGLLRRMGYALPVTATSALVALANGNALGAACLVESSAPVPNRQSMACKLYDNFKKMVLAGDLELDAAKDASNSAPRSNAANQATGFFTRLDYGTPCYDW